MSLGLDDLESITRTSGWTLKDTHPLMVPFYGPKIWVHHRYIYFGGSTPPQFARDMNAALMLTEEMRIEGYNTEIGNGTNGSWECHFCKYDSSSGERVRTASYLGFADTLPEAICKAYLLAMTS